MDLEGECEHRYADEHGIEKKPMMARVSAAFFALGFWKRARRC